MFPQTDIAVDEDTFLERFRRCDFDSKKAVMILLQALTEPTSGAWLNVGWMVVEQSGRLGAVRDETGRKRERA